MQHSCQNLSYHPQRWLVMVRTDFHLRKQCNDSSHPHLHPLPRLPLHLSFSPSVNLLHTASHLPHPISSFPLDIPFIFAPRSAHATKCSFSSSISLTPDFPYPGLTHCLQNASHFFSSSFRGTCSFVPICVICTPHAGQGHGSCGAVGDSFAGPRPQFSWVSGSERCLRQGKHTNVDLPCDS